MRQRLVKQQHVQFASKSVILKGLAVPRLELKVIKIQSGGGLDLRMLDRSEIMQQNCKLQ
jgi:hypothetical protein